MTTGQELLVVGLVLGAALMGVLFFHGRRRNRTIALRVSQELESALRPGDATYTWIGGLIGFHARYAVDGLEKARATCTLLPRHAPLYMPVALLLGRSDRVHVTLFLGRRFEGEAHVVAPSLLRSPVFEIEGREAMHERAVLLGGRRFVLLSTHVRLLDGLEALLGSMPSSRLVPSLRHLAFVPDL
ncbi:MAG: hypothetical protein JRG91_15125, partial [Deltaproteobacteria bacterium]|nr:hypothetical protein [Deltaproteobacteria bacterium]